MKQFILILYLKFFQTSFLKSKTKIITSQTKDEALFDMSVIFQITAQGQY